MKSRMYLLIVLVFFTIKGHAQGQPIVQISSKWDVSIDMYNIFKGNANVILRRTNHERGAFRFSLGYNEISQSKILDNPSVTTKVTSRTNDAFVGYEFQRNSGKTQLYSGADLGYWGNASTSTVNVVGSGYVNAIYIKPFAGIKYRITNELSVSLEANITFQYFTNKVYDHNNIRTNKTNSSSLAYVPLRFINVSYHF